MPSALLAAEPAIRNLNLRGLQVGATTTLIVDGDDLGTAPRLLLPFPAKQTLKPGATATKATFDISLDDKVDPGYHHLRIVTDGGVSLPVLIGVDRLPQKPFEGNIAQLPVALHGSVNGSATVETKFTGKAGQKVTVEVEAQRLGSKLRPIVHLYSPKRLQVAWSWNTPTLAGDTRLEATLPEDGVYVLSLHDAEYAAAAPSHFRLKVGQWAFADQVFPPVIGKDRPRSVELIGASARADVPASSPPGVLPLAWPNGGLWSGPRPFVRVSTQAEFVEQANPLALPAGSVGVSGRLLQPYEEDRFPVAVTPGNKLRLEVFAERLGSPLDVALVVRSERGDVLARAEDSPGSLDPALDYTVPDKVTAIVVGVADAQGRGGPRGIYRLTVEPQGATRPGFELSTPTSRVSLPIGGRAVLPVFVERRGYLGPIDLTAVGLPKGATLEGAKIPAGSDGTLVTVVRSEAASEAAITTWNARGGSEERTVLVKGHPLERLQPWLATELAVAPTTAKAAEFALDWRGLPADAGLVPASKLTLPVKLTRPAGGSVVRLTLLTSQTAPLVNNQPDPNRTLRPERPANELAANAMEGDFPVLVPPDLSSTAYDITLQAELLTADNRGVLAVAYAPVRHMNVRHSLVVSLDAGPVEAKLDPQKGATLKVQGKIERREGLKGDVTLTLTGLPAGATAAPVIVKADATDFAVNVLLPATQPPGELKGLKLAATAVADPKTPNVRVRSKDVDVTVLVKPAKS